MMANPEKIQPYPLKQDGKLVIAEGRSRRETAWKNREVNWSQLVARISITRRTGETMDEYRKMPKSQQDEIKDVGGFVGGSLKGGRRKSDAVGWRQIVSLDADHAPKSFWDKVELLTDFGMAVYSTHKHKPESPRLRLLIPLSRSVTAEEYQAVSRRIAADFGIDYFDDTIFEPARLMYWPSTSRDGEFFFQVIDEPWLDPSEWPESSRASQERKKLADRQGDLTLKPGIVGAFCREYSIEEAIETYLSDVYTSCDVPGRYTYSEGSTAGGLVLYEDHFVFSHHGTDPTSGKLCNAFDLVRIHKFSELDDEAKLGTPTVKLPSYTAMVEFAAQNEVVRTRLGEEKLSAALTDFEELEDDSQTDHSWVSKLKVDPKSGNFETSIDNVRIILENDARLTGKIRFDELCHRPVLAGKVPWQPKDMEPGTRWGDIDDSGLRHYIEQVYQIYAPGKVGDGRIVVMGKHRYHPVRDYLHSLTWDGVPRIDRLLIDYLGTDETEYTKTVTRKIIVAAVARAMTPSVKFDTMLVLVGSQGMGKSTLIKRIGKQWYSDSVSTAKGKESYEQLLGHWILEMPEMNAFRKADVETIKHFLSKQEDTFRPAYGHHPITFKRQSVFWGTTNTIEFLRDGTGNRRFWPVTTHIQTPKKNSLIDLNSEEVDQLWAEAVELWKQGEPHLSPEMEKEAIRRQLHHTEENPKLGVIQNFLEKKVPDNWDEMDTMERKTYLLNEISEEPGTRVRDRVCAAEIWVECFGGD